MRRMFHGSVCGKFFEILRYNVVCSGFLCNTTQGTLAVPLLARYCAFKELHTNLLGLDFDGAILHGCDKRNEKCMRIHSHKNDHSKGQSITIYLRPPAFCWLLMTFLTIFASSTRNARRMRDLTQSPHREPP